MRPLRSLPQQRLPEGSALLGLVRQIRERRPWNAPRPEAEPRSTRPPGRRSVRGRNRLAGPRLTPTGIRTGNLTLEKLLVHLRYVSDCISQRTPRRNVILAVIQPESHALAGPLGLRQQLLQRRGGAGCRFRSSEGLRHGEAACANQEAANNFIKEFSDYVKAEGFVPEQVFNCDETGLFWKKMPANTYITKEEKALPGHKPMKDRLTLLFCANASGDCKVKPLLVYHSDNPRPFKRHNVMKSKLAVMWWSNTKAWVTRQFFTEWVREVFAPRVKEYLAEKKLPLKCLLVMDNAPAHPPALEEDLVDDYSFIKVKFLPPNTTPILQPMDQQVISNFKKLYTKALFRKCFEVTNDTQLTLREFWKEHFNILNCVNLIDTAWSNVTHRTLYAAWRKLWPERDGEGLEAESAPVVDEDVAVVDDIVAIGKTMGLDIQQDDINELVEGHAAELTTEELMHLQQQQQKDMVEEISSEEEERVEDISSGLIHEMCAKWAEIANFVEQHHPDKVVANRAVNIFNDNVMSTFRKISERRKKQQTIEKFFRKEIRQVTAEKDSDSPQQKILYREQKHPKSSYPLFLLKRTPLQDNKGWYRYSK
ncbi:tigger transposable element-derived protein 1-like [Molossus molossus]|uniref:tigger transposable element-derived protein 1-like n=1 Tax=Molossus molossus TaxID=27622 RepID=UPI001745D9B0|nr:tigger transposable element-derived protein 1-like [Molossus molossus]